MDHLESCELSNLFIREMVDAAFWILPDGRIGYVNLAACSLLGYSEKELLNLYLTDLFEGNTDSAGLAEHWLRIQAEGQRQYETTLLARSGKRIIVEIQEKYLRSGATEVLCCLVRDISGQKLNQDRLIQSEEREKNEDKFLAVFHNAHVAMIISTRQEGIIIDANRKFYEQVGYSPEEVIGQSSRDLNLFADYDDRVKVNEMLVSEGSIRDMEVKIISRNGVVLTALLSIDTIVIREQEYILTSAIDITAQKEAEIKVHALLKQQKLLADISQLFNSSSHCIPVLNQVLALLGQHSHVSRVYIFENSPDGSATSNTFEWCNEGVEPQIDNLQNVPYAEIESWRQMILENESIVAVRTGDLPAEIVEILEPQGIKSILVYQLIVGGEFYGFIGFDECREVRYWEEEEVALLKTIANVISNYYERLEVSKKLESSELRLKLAIEGSGEGIWDWNNLTNELYVSDSWLKLLGMNREEFTPHVSTWESLMHDEDRDSVLAVMKDHLEGRIPQFETIHRMRTQGGAWRWFLDHGLVVQRDESGKPSRTIGTLIDITRQKMTEEELKAVVATRDKLFSIISHDLRGPVGSFLPVLELITEEDLDPEVRNEFMENLKKASRVTFNLLDNLLVWSNSQLNQISLSPEPLMVKTLIEDTVTLLSPLSNQKNQRVSMDPGQSLAVMADRSTLQLVLRNLLSNAIKFTPNGGLINLSAKQEGNFIEFRITDTGMGMEPEFAGRLFKEASYASAEGTNREKGTGLGLNLCKDFVNRNGGNIRVESVLNQGSSFIFTMPVL